MLSYLAQSFFNPNSFTLGLDYFEAVKDANKIMYPRSFILQGLFLILLTIVLEEYFPNMFALFSYWDKMNTIRGTSGVSGNTVHAAVIGKGLA